MLQFLNRLLIVLLIHQSASVLAEAQGVYRVLFADLAVVEVEHDLATRRTGAHLPNAPGSTFFLRVLIENLGDLPARDVGGELSVLISRQQGAGTKSRELVPAYWQYTGIVLLHDGALPGEGSLRSIQGGQVTAHGLRLPIESGLYEISVCLVFPQGAPFGDNAGNNCSITMEIMVGRNE